MKSTRDTILAAKAAENEAAEIAFRNEASYFRSSYNGSPVLALSGAAGGFTHSLSRHYERTVHMATSRSQIRTGIQVVLGLLIIGLAYFLYQSITEPYERIERKQRLTEETRQRMSHIRTALVDYERDSASFPDSLNLLKQHIRNDSILSTRQDSVFGEPIENVDSLFYSPRTGKQFQYALSDTGRVETYLLQDPDTDDEIGTLTGDPTKTHAASWE